MFITFSMTECRECITSLLFVAPTFGPLAASCTSYLLGDHHSTLRKFLLMLSLPFWQFSLIWFWSKLMCNEKCVWKEVRVGLSWGIYLFYRGVVLWNITCVASYRHNSERHCLAAFLSSQQWVHVFPEGDERGLRRPWWVPRPGNRPSQIFTGEVITTSSTGHCSSL